MQYLERKLKKGFKYKCEDVFGTLEIKSPYRLEPEMLDNIFDAVFKLPGHQEGLIKGTEIKYKLKRKSPWTK